MERTITYRAFETRLLRTAGIRDLEALFRFEVLCFQEHHFRQEHLAWILNNDHALTLILDGPEGVTAAMMLLFEGRACRILSVAVAPAARRRGIGTRLMQTAERICLDRGIPLIRLEVSTRNLAAIELYRHLGYRTDGVLYGYYSWGEDAYSMRKSIPLLARTNPSVEVPASVHTAL